MCWLDPSPGSLAALATSVTSVIVGKTVDLWRNSWRKWINSREVYGSLRKSELSELGMGQNPGT
jgi:hypothetical protein